MSRPKFTPPNPPPGWRKGDGTNLGPESQAAFDKAQASSPATKEKSISDRMHIHATRVREAAIELENVLQSSMAEVHATIYDLQQLLKTSQNLADSLAADLTVARDATAKAIAERANLQTKVQAFLTSLGLSLEWSE